MQSFTVFCQIMTVFCHENRNEAAFYDKKMYRRLILVSLVDNFDHETTASEIPDLRQPCF